MAMRFMPAWLLLLSLLPGASAADGARGPVPKGARVKLELDRAEHFLGENVLVHFCVENAGKEAFRINVGGDYRGASRPLRFQVTATDAEGNAVADPDPAGICMGGLSISPDVPPGKTFCQSLPINRYCRFQKPGVYTIRVQHDLGWHQTPGRKIPVAEATLTLAAPTEPQARKLLAEMYKRGNEKTGSIGRKREPYADFSTLRHPAYLPALVERARQGDNQAFAGIGSIATPEATEALVALAQDSKPAVAASAKLTLSPRLPDPRLQEESEGQRGLDTRRVQPRRYLVRNAWREAFGERVRTAALADLDNPRMVCWGAYALGCVGRVSDLAGVTAALDQHVAATRESPLETEGYPYPQGPCRALVEAAELLIRRGAAAPTEPRTLGETVVYLRTLGIRKDFRPAGWQQRTAALVRHEIGFVRRVALENLPLPPSDPVIRQLPVLLSDPHLAVRLEACRVAAASRAPELRQPVLTVLRSARDKCLVRQAHTAGIQLGVRYECFHVLASRLDEEGMQATCIDYLAELVRGDSGRNAGPRTSPEEARALKTRWLKFLERHRERIRKGRRFGIGDPELTPDLFPRRFRFLRRNSGTHPGSSPEGVKPVKRGRQVPPGRLDRPEAIQALDRRPQPSSKLVIP